MTTIHRMEPGARARVAGRDYHEHREIHHHHHATAAPSCPHCGHAIHESPTASREQTMSPELQQAIARARLRQWFCRIVAGVACWYLFCWSWQRDDQHAAWQLVFIVPAYVISVGVLGDMLALKLIDLECWLEQRFRRLFQ